MNSKLGIHLVVWRLRVSQLYDQLCRYLSETLPPGLINLLSDDCRYILYSCTASQLSASVASPGKPVILEAHRHLDDCVWHPEDQWEKIHKLADTLPSVLAIPAEQTFIQDIKLPLLAITDFKTTIANNLSVWTPFSDNDVVFDAIIKSIEDDYIYCSIFYCSLSYIKQTESDCNLKLSHIKFNIGNKKIINIKNKNKSKKIKYLNITLAISLFSALVLSFILYYSNIERDRNAINSKKLEVIAELLEQAKLENIISVTLNQLALLDDRAKDRYYLYPIIVRISNALPPDAALTSFDFSRGKGKFSVHFSAAFDSEQLDRIIQKGDFAHATYVRIDANSAEIQFDIEN